MRLSVYGKDVTDLTGVKALHVYSDRLAVSNGASPLPLDGGFKIQEPRGIVYPVGNSEIISFENTRQVVDPFSYGQENGRRQQLIVDKDWKVTVPRSVQIGNFKLMHEIKHPIESVSLLQGRIVISAEESDSIVRKMKELSWDRFMLPTETRGHLIEIAGTTYEVIEGKVPPIDAIFSVSKG